MSEKERQEDVDKNIQGTSEKTDRIEGTPESNGIKFCPFCGGHVEIEQSARITELEEALVDAVVPLEAIRMSVDVCDEIMQGIDKAIAAAREALAKGGGAKAVLESRDVEQLESKISK